MRRRMHQYLIASLFGQTYLSPGSILGSGESFLCNSAYIIMYLIQHGNEQTVVGHIVYHILRRNYSVVFIGYRLSIIRRFFIKRASGSRR